MKKFDIIELEKKNMILIPIFDCESPFSYLQEIALELKINDFSGTIIFDELLHSGNNDERFIECLFIGGEFLMESFHFVSIPKQDPRRRFMCFYLKEVPEFLELSGLTSQQIKLIQKGLVI